MSEPYRTIVYLAWQYVLQNPGVYYCAECPDAKQSAANASKYRFVSNGRGKVVQLVYFGNGPGANMYSNDLTNMNHSWNDGHHTFLKLAGYEVE